MHFIRQRMKINFLFCSFPHDVYGLLVEIRGSTQYYTDYDAGIFSKKNPYCGAKKKPNCCELCPAEAPGL